MGGSLPLRRALAASSMLSSDVSAGFDPAYASAFEAKNSGMVMAWPMPIKRSRLRTSPAKVIDRQEKNAAGQLSSCVWRGRS